MNTTQIIAIALNITDAADAAVPDWVQMTPGASDIKGRDGRVWKLNSPDKVVEAFQANGADLPIDYEHASEIRAKEGKPAPAVGWIKELANQDGAIWARVQWTAEGQRSIAAGEYRYISPVFTFKKTTREIIQMLSAGLTNQPNLKLAALNNKQGQSQENAMDKAITGALSLPESASETDVLSAINKLKEDKDKALNSAQTPDPEQFVPRADYDLAQNKISEFEKAKAGQLEVAINTAVDAAIEAGKIAPASRDYHISSCKAAGGLDAFNTMVEGAPNLVAPAKLGDPKDKAQNGAKLSDEEAAVCQAMGIDPVAFAKSKTETEEQEVSQ